MLPSNFSFKPDSETFFSTEVWVLTGDKVDTAISIAMSCKLLTDEMNNFIIDSDTEQKPLAHTCKLMSHCCDLHPICQ